MWNLLVVEDEPIARLGIRHMLNWNEINVLWKCEASNGEEALKMLEHEQIDIVLCDIRMPGMDGLELTKLILEKYPQIQIIFLSSYDHFEYVKEALRLGALDYLHKPTMDEFEVKAAMQKAIERLENYHAKPQVKLDASERNEILLALLDKFTATNTLPDELKSEQYENCWLSIIRIREDGLHNSEEQWPLLFISVQSLIEEYITKYWGGIVFQRNYREIIWIAPAAPIYPEKHAKRSKILEEIRTKVFEILNIAVIYTVSEIYEGVEYLPNAYMDALLQIPVNEQSDNLIVRKAKEYVDKHILEEVTLAKVAAEIHVSQGYLSRLFMKHVGETFSDYVIRNKMEYAQKLLRFTNKKIYEIASEIGYNNPHYFSKLFKDKTGMTPLEYRNQ